MITKCPDCDYTYVNDDASSKRAHRKFHTEAINGIHMPQLNRENTIWSQSDERVFVVTAKSSKAEKNRARKVGRMANIECQYDGGIYSEHELPDDREIHLFIWCKSNKAVGLLILEKRSNVCSYSWAEVDQRVNKNLKIINPIWSFGFIWTHKSHRMSGGGRMLVNEAINYLRVPLSSVGIYTPFSESGEYFYKALFPSGILVAK